MYLKQAKSEHRGTCIWTADPDHNKECQLICWYLEYTSRQRIYSYTPVGVLPMKSLGSVRWVFVRHLPWCITFGYYLFLEIYFFFYVVLPWFGDKYNVIMYAKRQVKWMLKEIWFGISPALLFLRHASCPCPETPECTMYSFVSFDSIMLWNLIRLHDIRRNHLTSWVTLLKVKALSLLFNSPCYVLEIWLSRNSSSSLYMALHICTLYNALQFAYSYTNYRIYLYLTGCIRWWNSVALTILHGNVHCSIQVLHQIYIYISVRFPLAQ